MNYSAAQLFLNKNVIVYPGDTYKKTAKVIAVDDNGVTFEVISYNGSDDAWKPGKLKFIAYSARLSMSEI